MKASASQRKPAQASASQRKPAQASASQRKPGHWSQPKTAQASASMGGRWTRQFVCPYELGHRDVTISEVRDFAEFRKWRGRRCWMLGLQIVVFQKSDPIGLFSCRIYIFVRLCFNKGNSFFHLTCKSNWKSRLKCLNTVLDRKVMREKCDCSREKKIIYFELHTIGKLQTWLKTRL